MLIKVVNLFSVSSALIHMQSVQLVEPVFSTETLLRGTTNNGKCFKTRVG